MNKIIAAAFILVIIAPGYAYAGQIGAKAPSFALPDLNGRTISLEQFKGKVVFLDFWAPWCIPCKQELPELDKLYKTYRKDGFEVIGISIDSSEKNVAAFLQKLPLSVYILIDAKNEVSDAYRVSSLPTGIIIGRDGVIHRVHKGFSIESLPIYEKEIDALLKQ
jgi:peroxiredoxin